MSWLLNKTVRNKKKINHIITKEYEGFPTDLQSQFMVLLCKANGKSSITENILKQSYITVQNHINLYEKNIKIKSELGLDKGGLRYSWGFPSCPDVSQQHLVWKLLQPEKSGMTITESGQIIPEQSTAAMVIHHPNAQYFVI